MELLRWLQPVRMREASLGGHTSAASPSESFWCSCFLVRTGRDMGSRDIRRIFKGIVINPIAPDRVDYYDPGYLVIEGERIARLTGDDPQSEFPGAEFRDMNDKIILPGFVDTHVHLPQFAIMGVGKGQLLTW